jgi:hypothetical protein
MHGGGAPRPPRQAVLLGASGGARCWVTLLLAGRHPVLGTEGNSFLGSSCMHMRSQSGADIHAPIVLLTQSLRLGLTPVPRRVRVLLRYCLQPYSLDAALQPAAGRLRCGRAPPAYAPPRVNYETPQRGSSRSAFLPPET